MFRFFLFPFLHILLLYVFLFFPVTDFLLFFFLQLEGGNPDALKVDAGDPLKLIHRFGLFYLLFLFSFFFFLFSFFFFLFLQDSKVFL